MIASARSAVGGHGLEAPSQLDPDHTGTLGVLEEDERPG